MTRVLSRTGIMIAFLVFCGVLAAQEQEVEIRIELLGPLGTQTSHKGDKVFGRVVAPDAYKGDSVEGLVRDVHSGSKLRGGGATLYFSFDTLTHAGQAAPITTRVKSFQNSQGQADVDEDGRIVRKGGENQGKSIGGKLAGGIVGGLAGGFGGLKSAAVSNGVDAASSISAIEITADSPNIRFGAGSIVTVSTGFGANAPATVAAATPAPAKTSSSAPAASAAVPASAATGGSAQPSFTEVKNDFIPGEETVFFDDFTDVEPGDALPHWKVRGGAVDVQVADTLRQITPKGPGSSSAGVAMTPMLKEFPHNFTIETEMRFNDLPQDARAYWYFHPKGDASKAVLEIDLYAYENGTFTLRAQANGENLAEVGDFPCDFSQPVSLGIWVQNGRLRLYVNGKRAIDVNQVDLPPLSSAQVETVRGDRGLISYRYFRIAESTPDFSHSILSTGRYVTYGILFDTDSDRIKPESATVIQSIAKALQANPALKLRIEGHTDSTGNADHNMDLSKRRAEAVKSVLASQFQIDAGRLSAAGMGATKPIASNDDPQGRSQNRRVEFVKQ